MRLMLIEDDPQLGKAIYQGLKQEHTSDWFVSAEEGNAALEQTSYDIIILDINLPGMSGLEWLKLIRNRKIATPVLLLTARDAISQKIEGLDAGADDYLIKPFDFDELLARIRALLRRKETFVSQKLHYKDITLDLSARSVTKNGENVALSSKEFELLHMLIENAGRCLSKEQLEQRIYSWRDELSSNTVEVYISGIRKQLGKNLIKTMRGIGYIVEREA